MSLEVQFMNASNMFKSAIAHNEDVIFYFDRLGNKYVVQGGSLAWRLNNPGLVRSHSHFARKNGSIGSHNGFAIFSSPIQARKALIDILRTKKYSNATLKTIIKSSPNLSKTSPY